LLFIAELDQVNAGFAALTINQGLGLTAECSALAGAFSSSAFHL
jgi:hypothetical protein